MKDESYHLLHYKKYILRGKESIFFLKCMDEDKILDKKKPTGKKSVYRLVDGKSFVDVALKIFGGAQL